MSSSKTKRTITVEKSTSDSNVKSKPSVFDRLGAPHSYGSSERQEICHDFANNGVCSYGSKCKYAHVSSRRDRDRERDRGSDDLRSRVSRKRDENESDQDAKKSLSQRKEKDSKIKSAVVVTKSTDAIDDIWPESTDPDKGSADHKHESKTRPQGLSSSHEIEVEGHKGLTKLDCRVDEKNDEGSGQQPQKSKNRSPKSPSHIDDGSSRRKSKDKKKKKRNRSQGSRSPDRVDEKQDQKHQKDSSKSSSDKHSKSISDVRKVETSSAGAAFDKKSKEPKDDKSRSVENRLIMLAMDPDAGKMESGRTARGRSPVVKGKRDPSPHLSKAKDVRKDYTSPSSRSKDVRKERVESPPSKSKKLAKERSLSPTQFKEARRERSISPTMNKERNGKGSHQKSYAQSSSSLSRVSDKPKNVPEEKSLGGLEKYESHSHKQEKGKAVRRKHHSTSSSASSSSSSSSGSDSGSSSGSSSTGSSSSSSSSSDVSSDERKPVKGQKRKAAKSFGRQYDKNSGRLDDTKEVAKGSDRSKKEKERLPGDSSSHGRRQTSEKDKGKETAIVSGKDELSKKDFSPEKSRRKDWEKGSVLSGQDVGFDSKKGRAPSLERDKKTRDVQYASRSGESLRLKTNDAVEYGKKARSPLVKDEKAKALTPVDTSRRGQSPTESLRSHHSTKPTHLLAEQEREYEGQSSLAHYRDCYVSRDKASRKEDERYQQYSEEIYCKKLQERGDPRSQSYSSHKQHPVDPYDRTRDGAEPDRDDRDSRYSRDRGYDVERYPTSADRHHTDISEESRSRQDFYSSSYRDERRSGRVDDSSRKDPDRSEKHIPSYEARDPEHDYDARDREKTRDQRTSDYREKTRGDSGEHSASNKYKKDEGHLDDSRRERTSRRSQWESEREADDQSRQTSSRSDPRGYGDKKETSRKRPLEDDGGSGRSPCAKKMREGSPSDSHYSFSSRTAYDRDAERLDKERDRSQRGRIVGREDDRHAVRSEGEYREKSRSERERVADKDWESSRRHDSKDRSKDSKAVAEARDRGLEVKESWHREESSKRRRSPGDKGGSENWDRSKDWKRSRTDLETVEREKPIDRASRRDEDHRGSPTRERSPKPSGYVYKPERSEVDKRPSDSQTFKSLESDVDGRGGRVKSEEKRDVIGGEPESSMIPVHVEGRMRRSLSRGSLSSKHSQRDRDRDSRRDERHYDDRYDLYRDSHYREERLPGPERSFDHEDREAWMRDRVYDRIRSDEDSGRPYRGPAFDHDRTERDLPKNRDFDDNDWELEPFRRDNLGYRGMPRAPNWERERPREEWESRYDRGLEQDYRARRDVLLPPPPRPRPVPEVRVPSPLPPPVETLAPPPVEHLAARVDVKPEHVTPSKTSRGSKEEDTGYDDISDGELDDLIGIMEEDKEDTQVRKTGVVDILDIKWESLMQSSIEKPAVPCSVKNRFSSAAIFRKIGISRAFAGEELLNRAKALCQKQLEIEAAGEVKEEKEELEGQLPEPKIKEELDKPIVKEEPEDGCAGKPEPVKNIEEPQPPSTKPAPVKFELLDDIADFHAGLQLKASERVGVVRNIGPYRRALCARRDLAIRRGLCKVDKEEILMFPTHIVDQDLYKQSLQLFHQDRTVEKKLPVNMSLPHRPQPMPAASA